MNQSAKTQPVSTFLAVYPHSVKYAHYCTYSRLITFFTSWFIDNMTLYQQLPKGVKILTLFGAVVSEEATDKPYDSKRYYFKLALLHRVHFSMSMFLQKLAKLSSGSR